jgi:D-amino-acid oxidase
MVLMRVTVLGAGAVGLTTAIRLLEAGCEVRVVTAAPIEATTSYITAGIWFPTHVGPPGLVAGWGRRTFEVLAGQAQESVPGVVMRESLALYRQPPGRPDWTASVGPVRDATPDELPPGYRYGLRFAVPQAEMPIYQPWLVQQVTERGGEIVIQDVGDLAELAGPGVDAVVDCPGLGARELVGDLSVYPVRGQIVRVKNPGLVMSVRDEFHPAGRAYVHPRSSDCILGGTLDEHQWDIAPDPATAEAIITRCMEIVPALADADVIDTIAGLRPGRPEVRLEDAPAAAGPTRIIHNYGHGGAGITLSWGCAEDVAQLLGQSSPTRLRSPACRRASSGSSRDSEWPWMTRHRAGCSPIRPAAWS